jgi:ubiquinone/menaquinone biosynthesis C-methylase UbiE
MPTNPSSRSGLQILAWSVLSLFVLGFFYPIIGAWTGAILGVWFVGTQRPLRGFLWMLAFDLVPGLAFNWRSFPLSGPPPALEYLGWMTVASLLGVLPFVFHRLIGPRLPGLLSTLPLPLCGTAFHVYGLSLLPLQMRAARGLLMDQQANKPLYQLSAVFGIGIIPFFILWFAAVVVWMWNHEFRRGKIAVGASVFGAIFVCALGYGLFRQLSGGLALQNFSLAVRFSWACLGVACVLIAVALFNRTARRPWATRPQAVALLQSPFTGNPLQLVTEDGRETLVSSSGEEFPIRNGIPTFLKPEDLTGDNGKYNHLYETIGGFYDDIQRVFLALKGFDRDAYFRSYMSRLEVKPGDTVLETSVGTGLNFKYLPRNVKLAGLDLSPEMLANCQANLRRWQMDADLYLGNAESLPFTDSSFDVVFHVGGINFFNDRAKAIREMIRVARPGSLLLIADETEKHVKDVYEKGLGGYYKGRKQPVSAPVDLVPPEMEEIHLEQMREGEWYTLTFRKPAAAGIHAPELASTMEA